MAATKRNLKNWMTRLSHNSCSIVGWGLPTHHRRLLLGLVWTVQRLGKLGLLQIRWFYHQWTCTGLVHVNNTETVIQYYRYLHQSGSNFLIEICHVTWPIVWHPSRNLLYEHNLQFIGQTWCLMKIGDGGGIRGKAWSITSGSSISWYKVGKWNNIEIIS